MGLSGGRGTRYIHGLGNRQPIPSDRNLSIDQNGQHHLPFRLSKTFRRGSVDADPMTWMVTQAMREAEIKKARKAKAEQSGGMLGICFFT